MTPSWPKSLLIQGHEFLVELWDSEWDVGYHAIAVTEDGKVYCPRYRCSYCGTSFIPHPNREQLSAQIERHIEPCGASRNEISQ